MSKQFLQDVVPPEKRSIRDIPIPDHRRVSSGVSGNVVKIPVHNHTDEEVDLYEKDVAAQLPPRHDFVRYALWATAFIAASFLVFSLLLYFAKATITVVPKTLPLSVNASITADRSGAANTLPYETIIVAKSSTAQVTATGERFVSNKATGIITIYNDFSNAPQRLIKNTRFETKDGLIFRIESSLTVPGKSVKNGTVEPGQIDAVVVADEAGEKYNIAGSEFTIPGFKSDALRFKSFYGRSAQAMTGGFLGNMKAVDPVDERAARTELDTRLQASLLKEIVAVVPQGYLLFPAAFSIATNSSPITTDADGKTFVRQNATATAYIFSEHALAESIARSTMGEAYKNEPVKIPSISDFSIEILRTPSEANPTLALTVRGQTTLVWRFDVVEVKKMLIGQSKKELQTILSAIPALTTKTTAVVRPFFKGSFPSNPDRIEVIEKLD